MKSTLHASYIYRESFTKTNPVNVLIDVSIQPIMYHYVPRAIVVSIRIGVPPILEQEGKENIC